MSALDPTLSRPQARRAPLMAASLVDHAIPNVDPELHRIYCALVSALLACPNDEIADEMIRDVCELEPYWERLCRARRWELPS